MIIIVKFIKYKRGKIVINFMLVTIIASLTIFMCFISEDSTVVVDGKQIELVSYEKTFGNKLSSTELDDDIIVNLKVLVDNKEINVKSLEENVSSMLKEQKITLGAADKISPSLETKLSQDIEVIITRVTTKTITQTISTDFKTVIQNDNNTLKSKSRISQNGVAGKKTVTYNVIYYNGKEVSKKVVSEKVIIAPKNKIIVQGTLKPITFSRGGSSKTSEDVISVKSTAYWAVNGVNNTYTASGKKAVRNPNGYSTIAVDTNIIPMGTKLYVEGYGYAIAADKGSGIKGKFIDVFFNTREEALNWGVKYIKVQIID